MMKASVWLAGLGIVHGQTLPKLVRRRGAKASTDGEFVRVGKEAFSACPSDSIDYAVMERLRRREWCSRSGVAGGRGDSY